MTTVEYKVQERLHTGPCRSQPLYLVSGHDVTGAVPPWMWIQGKGEMNGKAGRGKTLPPHENGMNRAITTMFTPIKSPNDSL